MKLLQEYYTSPIQSYPHMEINSKKCNQKNEYNE